MINERPDAIDKDVLTNTLQVRKMYADARQRLHLPPKELSPVVLMQRSVR